MTHLFRLAGAAFAAAAFSGMLGATAASAAPVYFNFDALPVGPSNFGAPSQTIVDPGVATFSGGTVLGFASAFPAQSYATSPNVYGTTNYVSSDYQPQITITIDPTFKVSEVSFAAFNGDTIPVSYTAIAYSGQSIVDTQTVLYASNSDSGNGVIDLLGPNITSVVFAPTVPATNYDFIIDTVGFNGNIMSTVPLPASAPMFGAALLGLGLYSFRMKRKQVA